ncbi:MAG TPA: hydantoinase B/oxoprolinase family protein, partial [Kofleriaceae bacterium]|nr:hydantoinase B/oxoprolinase family protein [Kofleriaceae bacterium]
GFFDIAVHHMAEAIRKVSIARGHDARDHALVVFGGAGGQFAGPVARVLGIRTLVFDRFAGVLSAYGIGLAPLTFGDEVALSPVAVDAGFGRAVKAPATALAAAGIDALVADGALREQIRITFRVDLRYAGADAAITLALDDGALLALDRDPDAVGPALAAAFHQRHGEGFGFSHPDRAVEATVLRLEATAHAADWPTRPAKASPADEGQISSQPAPAHRTTPLFNGETFDEVPVYHREDLTQGCRVVGPALILDATGTIVVDAGLAATVVAESRIVMRDETPPEAKAAEATAADPIRIEIFNNLFASIAEQMGADLRRAAVSTNIRERLDFSCAIFDDRGDLIANAPHIPVHLGAMAESVKAVIGAHPDMARGSAFATNDPAMGGSHLPDVTVLVPVFDDGGTLRFFSAARGHHADIGGTSPGSMPADSRTLSEEGVVLRALPIVATGRLDEARILAVLEGGPYPARAPRDNIADLVAQLAACHTGARLLARAWADHGIDTLSAYARHVQDNAAAHVAAEIAKLADGVFEFADALDDGTPIRVRITVAGDRMDIDFSGTGSEHPGNLNAPRAVTTAAVIYVLRCLCNAPIPLNSGCLRPVTVHVPARSVLFPGPERAVCGGNVETSQRIVDVLLGALGIAAASQGTMNNLTFGGRDFGYYETIAGGAGATANRPGASAVHTHMTNTRMTDPEVLEARFPVRATELSIRRGSGGDGDNRGGDGMVRELEVLAPMDVAILSERRARAPFGLAGGEPGARGDNLHNGKSIGGRASFAAMPGDRIRIVTPGGGGFGKKSGAP